MTGGPIMIMAGGTGGHVFPALAVANELRRRRQAVVWLGTRQGLEARIVPDAGIDIEWIAVSGLRGKGAAAWFIAPFRLARAVWQALGIMRRRRPIAVLGMGGFASGPGGLAAFLTRRPLVIHEQNAIAGLTNRLLAGFARVVLQAFPGSFSDNGKARTVGNPVRDDISSLPQPGERYAQRGGPLRLLVLGGSLGALALNRSVAAAVALLSPGVRPSIRHQAGERTIDAARVAYADAGVEADVIPFIANMAEAYNWADVVICRAGALTVAEIAAAGLPAVFVPYPYAVDDHQSANARGIVDAGAAVLIQEDALTPQSLKNALLQLGQTRDELRVRAERARNEARPDALGSIADVCLQVAGVTP